MDRRTRARAAAAIAFAACLPAGFYLGITLVGHARFIPYVSAWLDRLILAGAMLGLPALAAYGAHRFLLRRQGIPAGALFWTVGATLTTASLAFGAFYAWTWFDERERIVVQTRIGGGGAGEAADRSQRNGFRRSGARRTDRNDAQRLRRRGDVSRGAGGRHPALRGRGMTRTRPIRPA